MMKLRCGSKILIANLEVAETYWSRTKGLLGRKSLDHDQALWIHRCNSIHTFFMQFSIDVIFVDKNLKVRKTYSRVRPGRLILPVWRAESVIELGEGFLTEHPLAFGEQLHVDHSLS